MVHLTVECAVVLRSGKYRGEIGTSLLAELPVRRRGVGQILPTMKVYIHAHLSSTNSLSVHRLLMVSICSSSGQWYEPLLVGVQSYSALRFDQ